MTGKMYWYLSCTLHVFRFFFHISILYFITGTLFFSQHINNADF